VPGYRARRIIKQGHGVFPHHVEDIAQALELSIAATRCGGCLITCADDDPGAASGCESLTQRGKLLGLPCPAIPFEEADMTTMVPAAFYAESKKVRKRPHQQALGWFHLPVPGLSHRGLRHD